MELYFHDLDRDVLILAADGGLNSDTASTFISNVEGVAAAGIQKLIVDCSNLSFISSMGLRMLLTIHARMKSRGCDVRIAGAKSFVLDTIRLSRLDRLLKLYPDVNAARLSFRPKDAVAKRELREKTREALSQLDELTREDWSRRICDRLLQSDLLAHRVKPAGAPQAGPTVMLYAPMPDAWEVDIARIAEAITAPPTPENPLGGGRICVPRIDWATRTMRPALVKNLKGDLVPEFTKSGMALLAPRPDAKEIEPAVLDAIILPGLAFDYSGNRLGRGAGFYDRFLAGLPADVPSGPRRIGVAFDVQLADTVPTDEHDARLHALVTPTLLLRFT